jgi:hypothetical protein
MVFDCIVFNYSDNEKNQFQKDKFNAGIELQFLSIILKKSFSMQYWITKSNWKLKIVETELFPWGIEKSEWKIFSQTTHNTLFLHHLINKNSV